MNIQPRASSGIDACGKAACCAGNAASNPAALPQAGAASAAGQLFRIRTMDCSVEESEIRQALEPIAGIRALGFQLSARTLMIDASSAACAEALEAIRKAGFDPRPVTAEGTQTTPGDSVASGHAHAHGQDAGTGPWPYPVALALALALAIGAELLSYLAPDLLAWKAAGMALAMLAIALAGLDTYQKGIAALRRGSLNINALMAVAVTGAFLIGQWPEAAMVMALYAIAEWIEAKAVDRARNAIKGLLDLAPGQALMRQPDGAWALASAASIASGATLRIKPGERVPLDGVVTRGSSAVNQAPITGESLPVDKAPGDAVFAGTVNETGELEMRVTAGASDTQLARIIHAVEQAQGSRAPTQRFVDRFAAVYTPAVFVIALAVAVVMPLLLGLSWLDAAYKALVLLVIACPCALVISTPVTVVSGLSAAARRGILIKGGVHLENARLLKALALDKTGTVTEGKPRLVEFSVWETENEGDEAQLRHLGASLASRSDHPVSRAIAAGLTREAAEVHDFQALPGRGAQGRVDSRVLRLGNHRLMHESGLCGPGLEAALAVHEQQGRSVTLLADETRVLALFVVADTVKPGSVQAIAELKALGIVPVMLTGDNPRAAGAIAAQAGIEDVRGDLLPEDKLAAIAQLQQRYGRAGMVGDGINDAPALARSDLGFAMGAAGTDTAMEAADVVIMNDDLRQVGETIRLSRRTHAILWQNITLALSIKSVFLLLAVFGTATMWMAVFADMGASLLVVANGMRLLRGADSPVAR